MATRSNNYFDRARASSAAGLVAAGAAAIVGSVLDWVTVAPPIVVPVRQVHQTEPFTGIEAGDGQVVIGAAIGIIVCAALMMWRKKGLYAWLAFVTSMLIGGIAIADYRGIDTLFYQEMNRIGDPAPAFGLQLVVLSALIGLIASIAGIAASPHVEEEE